MITFITKIEKKKNCDKAEEKGIEDVILSLPKLKKKKNAIRQKRKVSRT